MAKAPQDPKEIFQEITDDYKAVFGEDLVSIILYGSAVGRDYRPGKSDINSMIVLTENGMDRLDQAFKTMAKWRKRHVAVPLFLTEDYEKSSLDVFPIEYLNFQRRHVLVHGKDILSGLSFDKEYLRLQCEREVKGKLLLLREAFMESEGKARALKDVIGHSVGAFAAIFEALLYLKDMDIPDGKRDVIRTAAEAYELDQVIFFGLMDIKEQRIKMNDAQVLSLFQDYLKEVRKLAKIVDELGG